MTEQKNKLKIFCVVGTRPEFIKMYPVYKRFWELGQKKYPNLEVKWISSSQHTDLLKDLYKFFKLKADYKFPEYSSKADLSTKAAKILGAANKLFNEDRPDLVIVQGDTLTSQQVALAAFYQRIPIAHIEAGLRTNNIYSPFPEELARRTISQISELDFTPTENAQNTLEAEKILFKRSSHPFLTGNTVIDTLKFTVDKLSHNFDWGDLAFAEFAYKRKKINLVEALAEPKRSILITSHRRENNYSIQCNLTNALYRLAQRFKDDDSIRFIVSIHKNPEARKAFTELNSQLVDEGINNIMILESLNYPLFIHLLQEAYFVVTDSGGIQEEAPYLCTPVLVFRNETERIEGIEQGFSKLIGTEEHVVHGAMLEMLTNDSAYQSMIKFNEQPYGDGLAAERIAEICLLYLRVR